MTFPIKKILVLGSVLTTVAAFLRNQFRNLLLRIFPDFYRWSKFRRHFVKNLFFGIVIEALVVVLIVFKFSLAVDFQNYVLDSMMTLSADTAPQWRQHLMLKPSDDPRPTQMFIDVDEQTYRNPAWGGGEPNTLPLDKMADLISTAVANGARYVLVDFSIEGPGDERQIEFISRMEDILKQHPNSHLLFVRTMRQPLELYTAKSVRPSALDKLIESHAANVHAVAPNFLLSSDHVLRYWRLWESACTPLPDEPNKVGAGYWVIVPSPQLVIKSVEEGHTLPQPIELPCAVDGAESDVLDQAESVRKADWLAGRWVFENLNTCYQQDGFKTKNCRDAKPPEEQKQMEATSEIEGEDLGNRILFLQSDWVRKNAETARQGKIPTTPKDPYFFRISALNILTASPPAVDALGKLKNAAQNKAVTVAVIGASYEDSRDTHLTPLGAMPGAMVLVNAIDTLQAKGILQSSYTGIKIGFVVLMLVGISAAFALLSALWASVLMLVLVGLTMVPLSFWFLQQGIWLDFSAPIMGIYLHHQWEELQERFNRKTHH